MGGQQSRLSDGRILNDFLESIVNIDLGSIMAIFAWMNNRDTQGLVNEKLDLTICSSEWLLNFPKTGVLNLSIVDSDYAQILVNTLMEKKKNHL